MAQKPTSTVQQRTTATQTHALTKPAGIEKRKTRKRPRKVHPKVLGPSEPETHQHSRLLALPAELRLMIWEYALTSPTGTLRYHPPTGRFDVTSIGAALLTTSYSVALETLYLPLKYNTLVFDSGSHEINSTGFLMFTRRVTAIEDAFGNVLNIKGVTVGPHGKGTAGVQAKLSESSVAQGVEEA